MASAEADRRFPARPVVGVGAVVLTAAGRVVLVRRGQAPLAGRWSLPGGVLELGETWRSGTAREVLEETGLTVDVGPVIDAVDHIDRDPDGAVRYHYALVDFVCHVRAGAPAAGSDVVAVAEADPADLGAYGLAAATVRVIARGCALAGAGGRA